MSSRTHERVEISNLHAEVRSQRCEGSGAFTTASSRAALPRVAVRSAHRGLPIDSLARTLWCAWRRQLKALEQWKREAIERETHLQDEVLRSCVARARTHTRTHTIPPPR